MTEAVTAIESLSGKGIMILAPSPLSDLESGFGFGVASIQYTDSQHLCVVKGFFEYPIALVEIVYCIDVDP